MAHGRLFQEDRLLRSDDHIKREIIEILAELNKKLNRAELYGGWGLVCLALVVALALVGEHLLKLSTLAWAVGSIIGGLLLTLFICGCVWSAVSKPACEAAATWYLDTFSDSSAERTTANRILASIKEPKEAANKLRRRLQVKSLKNVREKEGVCERCGELILSGNRIWSLNSERGFRFLGTRRTEHLVACEACKQRLVRKGWHILDSRPQGRLVGWTPRRLLRSKKGLPFAHSDRNKTGGFFGFELYGLAFIFSEKYLREVLSVADFGPDNVEAYLRSLPALNSREKLHELISSDSSLGGIAQYTVSGHIVRWSSDSPLREIDFGNVLATEEEARDPAKRLLEKLIIERINDGFEETLGSLFCGGIVYCPSCKRLYLPGQSIKVRDGNLEWTRGCPRGHAWFECVLPRAS